MLPGYMGWRSLLSSRRVSYHQGQLAATRQMVPTWMVPPPPTASLRWLDRGWLGASAIRGLGRRQVVGSNWQRLTKSLAEPTNRGVVVSAQSVREALEARASPADRMQHIHCHRRTPLSFKAYAKCNSVMNQPQRDRAEVLTFVQRADAFPCHRRSHPAGAKIRRHGRTQSCSQNDERFLVICTTPSPRNEPVRPSRPTGAKGKER